MNTIDLRPVADRLDETAPRDVSALHARIQRGMRRLAEKAFAALPVTPHPAAIPYHRYQADGGGLAGSVHAYSGAPLDWAIDSHIADVKRGFCNHHLTLWLDSTVAVPHFGLAMGTIPQLFLFCDLVPRSDLWVNTAELDRYHARFNQRALDIAVDPHFRPFVSREPYIREAISPVGICVQGEASEANIDRVLALADETLTQWLAWVAERPPVPAEERAPLAARDELVRRTICWRDPANVIAERVLGKATTDNLVRLLSGEARRS